MRTVTLYTKPDCCLCEQALEVIERARREQPFELETVDITRDSRLTALYGERIPVVLVDGVQEFEYHVDERALRVKVVQDAGARA
jgi:glutaredoxin